MNLVDEKKLSNTLKPFIKHYLSIYITKTPNKTHIEDVFDDLIELLNKLDKNNKFKTSEDVLEYAKSQIGNVIESSNCKF